VSADHELQTMAREIIDASRYLVLGTAGQAGNPWTSPVWYAPGAAGEFLWVSRPDARHSRNIAERPEVSLVIFDSALPPGATRAVYVSGTASELAGADLESGIRAYSRRSAGQGLPAWAADDVTPPAEHRLYRAVASEISVLRPGGVDVRIPVDLSPRH
jgi:nitroimidazol reductase NimA-like FMN-containing flavoprotein (pyridoxamine 5'-phosphate oxidase superfamily)